MGEGVPSFSPASSAPCLATTSAGRSGTEPAGALEELFGRSAPIHAMGTPRQHISLGHLHELQCWIGALEGTYHQPSPCEVETFMPCTKSAAVTNKSQLVRQGVLVGVQGMAVQMR